MNRLSTPMRGESLADAGDRIRTATPIRGDRATDEDCRNRWELIDDTLAALGIRAGERVGYTAQQVDGHVAGVWAHSAAEAELDLTVWWGVHCHWVTPDPAGRLLDEYFPRGKRSAAEADRRFLLAPPRRLRDQFAPAGSLLDGIWPSLTETRSKRG